MAHTATAHCSLIEQPVFRFTWLRNWLLRDLRKAATDISLNTWNCLKIGDVRSHKTGAGARQPIGGLRVSVGSGGARALPRVRLSDRRGIAAPLPGHGGVRVGKRASVWTDVDEHAAEVTFDVDDGEDRDARLKRDRAFELERGTRSCRWNFRSGRPAATSPSRSPRVPWGRRRRGRRARRAAARAARRAPRAAPPARSRRRRGPGGRRNTFGTTIQDALPHPPPPSDQRMPSAGKPVTWTMQSSTALFLALSKFDFYLPATRRPSLSADDSSARAPSAVLFRLDDSIHDSPSALSIPRPRTGRRSLGSPRECASASRRQTQPCRWRNASE